MRIMRLVPAVLAVALLAACGGTPTPPPAAVGVATTLPATPSARAPVRAPARTVTDANVAACRALEDHPAPTTAADDIAYAGFLVRESMTATDPTLQREIMSIDTGRIGVAAGTVPLATLVARVKATQATCDRYGVTG